MSTFITTFITNRKNDKHTILCNSSNEFTLELERLQQERFVSKHTTTFGRMKVEIQLCYFCKNKSDICFIVSSIGKISAYHVIHVCKKHIKKIYRKNKTGGYTFSMPISNIDSDDLECS